MDESSGNSINSTEAKASILEVDNFQNVKNLNDKPESTDISDKANVSSYTESSPEELKEIPNNPDEQENNLLQGGHSTINNTDLPPYNENNENTGSSLDEAEQQEITNTPNENADEGEESVTNIKETEPIADKEIISATDEKEVGKTGEDTIIEGTNVDESPDGSILEGGGYVDDGQVYEIDYILADDKELINLVKVNSVVDRYINNYYSENMKRYKQTFKTLYQKYGNKRFIIHNIGDVITVMKNMKNDKKADKKNEVIMELKKPKYLYYNVDGNLETLKRKISNERADLQFSYQLLVNKLNVDIEEKKTFEKKRKQFIELLETYYIYTLYHKKINKISTTNKVNLIIQDLLADSKKLNGNIYSIDISTIDLINKQNAVKLNEYNELVSRMQSIKNIKNNKQIEEIIKQYLNNNETTKLLNSTKNIAKTQDNYIDYIVLSVPNN